MSGAGGVTSMGSTFGFLGGRLWGRGRLTAPPTAAVEPNRDINKTTTTSTRYHAAAILWILRDWFKWDWNVLVSNLFSTSLCLHCCISLFFPSVCSQLVVSALLNLQYGLQELHKKTESMRQTVETSDGWWCLILTGFTGRMRSCCSSAVCTSEPQRAAWLVIDSIVIRRRIQRNTRCIYVHNHRTLHYDIRQFELLFQHIAHWQNSESNTVKFKDIFLFKLYIYYNWSTSKAGLKTQIYLFFLKCQFYSIQKRSM